MIIVYTTDSINWRCIDASIAGCLSAEMSEKDLVRRSPVFRVPLETGTLEILDRPVIFREFFSYRISEDPESTVLFPVSLEPMTEPVTSGLEESGIGIVRRGYALKWLLIPTMTGLIGSQPAQQNSPFSSIVRVMLEDCALEVLNSSSVLGYLLSERITEAKDSAIVAPVIEEIVTQVVTGLRKVDLIRSHL